MNYLLKYIKYKNKYLELKQNMQDGGDILSRKQIELHNYLKNMDDNSYVTGFSGVYQWVNNNPDSKILLGTNKNGTVPISPVLLGDQTTIMFEKIIETLNNLGTYLYSATSNPEGGPVVSVQHAGTQLLSDIKGLCDQLEKCLSTKVYTV